MVYIALPAVILVVFIAAVGGFAHGEPTDRTHVHGPHPSDAEFNPLDDRVEELAAGGADHLGYDEPGVRQLGLQPPPASDRPSCPSRSTAGPTLVKYRPTAACTDGSDA